MKDGKVIKLSDVLAKKLHEQLIKWCVNTHYINHLAGGIYQFYPEHVKFSKYHMYVHGECGEKIVIPMPDNHEYWEGAQKIHDLLNKGACV